MLYEDGGLDRRCVSHFTMKTGIYSMFQGVDTGVLYSLEIPNSPVSVHSYFAVEILKEVAEGLGENCLGEDSYKVGLCLYVPTMPYHI